MVYLQGVKVFIDQSLAAKPENPKPATRWRSEAVFLLRWVGGRRGEG